MRARAIDVRTHAVQIVAFLVAVGLVASSTSTFVDASQNTPPRPPVIDVHSHLAAENGPQLMDSLNIRYLLLAGNREGFAKVETMANRYLPALSFPCPSGRELMFGRGPVTRRGPSSQKLAGSAEKFKPAE